MSLAFSLPVWGQHHLNLFLETALPSLLSPGNLPSLSNRQASRFCLYTRPEDEALLRNAPSVRYLTQLMPVEIQLIEGQTTDPYYTMSMCHMRTMRMADDADMPTVFLGADAVASDGSVARLEQLASSGVSVVYISGVRTKKDEIQRCLARHRSSDGIAITIDPRTLVRYMLDHLHESSKLHFWREYPDCGLVPANLYWRVSSEGLLLRCFHLHPLMVRPQRKCVKLHGSIDHDLVPAACPDASRDYVVLDSDELHFIELSGPGYVLPHRHTKGSAVDVAAWAEMRANRRHRRLFDAEIRLHAGPLDAEQWRPVSLEAQDVVKGVMDILSLPTLAAAWRYPRVVEWRMYSRMLRGRSSPGPILRQVLPCLLSVRRALLSVQRRLNSRLRSKHPQ
jgi:hypothetical protein